MRSSQGVGAKQRLREQVRREQRLVDAVLLAEGRLATEIGKRDAAMAVHAAAIDARRDTLAEAIAAYLHDAGVSVARAAAVLDQPEHEITRLLRERRRTGARTGSGADARNNNMDTSTRIDSDIDNTAGEANEGHPR